MIKLENIVKRFQVDQREVLAIDDVSLEIEDGEIFGIIGFSGAGKSTLVRCINLLERPTSGRVYVNGTELTTLEANALRQVRQSIGMIFQHFNLMPSRTVAENIEMPLKLTGMNAKDRAEKIESLLAMVGLSDKANDYPSQLSGGQKQRVAIARALANDPKVLLCDEATSALDPQTTQSILQLLKEVNRKLGLTLVIITHQMSVIKEVCDRVAVMQDGRVMEVGSVMQVFSQPQARITKDFIETADNMGTFFELLRTPGAIAGIENQNAVWLLTYQGVVAGESLMIELYKRFGVQANIVYGNIDFLKGETLGKLGVGITGETASIEAAKAYLMEKGVRVEVLK